MKKIIFLIVFMTLAITSIEADSLEDLFDGDRYLPKTVSKEVELADDLKGVMVAHDEGLVLLGTDHKITTSFPVYDFEVIDDLSGDGVKDIAVVFDTFDSYDNIAYLDGKNGEIIKSAALKRTSYQGTIETYSNAYIYQLTYEDDRLYVLADHKLVVFDMDASEIFSFEANDNLWDIAFLDNDQTALISQDGHLYYLDNNGKLQHDLDLTSEDIIDLEYQTYPFKWSAFDLLYKDGRLFVALENDLISVFGDDGVKIKDIEVGLYDPDELLRTYADLNYYLYSGEKIALNNLQFSYFKNYKLEDLGDKILVLGNFGDEHCIAAHEAPNSKGLALLDPVSLEITALTSANGNVLSGNALYQEDDQTIIAPLSTKENTLTLGVFSKDDLSIIKQVTFDLAYNGSNAKIDLNYLNDEILVTIIDEGLYTVDESLDEIAALFDYSQAKLLYHDEDKLIVRFGLDGIAEYNDDLAYTKLTLGKEYKNTSGYKVLKYDKESNTLAGIVDHKNEDGVYRSDIILIDLDEDAFISQEPLVNSYYYENGIRHTLYYTFNDLSFIADLNGDGYKELLIENLIIDPVRVKILYTIDTYVKDNGKLLYIGDVNEDGISDLVNVNDKNATLYTSKISYDYVSYQKTRTVYEFESEKLENQTSATIVKDLNSDGIAEIVVNGYNDKDIQVYEILSGKDLERLFAIPENGVLDINNGRYTFTDTDYNNDGVNDIIFSFGDGEGEIYSGKDGTLLYFYNYYSYGETSDSYIDYYGYEPVAFDHIMPFETADENNYIVKINDINNDGKDDLVYFERDPYSRDPYLCYVDGATFEIIKKDAVSSSIRSVPEIKVLDEERILFYGEGGAYIYNINASLKEVSFDIAVKDVFSSMDQLFIKDNNDELYLYRPENDLKIIESQEEGSLLKLSFQKPELIEVEIIENGSVIAKTTDNELTLKMLKGEHDLEIVFKDIDATGIIQNLHLSINKSDTVTYIAMAVVVILLILSIGMISKPLLNRYKGGKKR